MNNRIEELYNQALVAAGKERQFDTTNVDVAEKFAELIVKECATLCVGRTSTSDHYNAGRMHCADDIKKSFGIK